MQFFIGTTNPNKVAEIASILFATGCTLTVTDPVNPEETEDDFDGNALLKARVYAKHTGGITISEESGLIISHLNGLPRTWSARFSDCIIDRNAGKVTGHSPSDRSRELIDRANNELVIELMKGVEQPRRAACFRVVLAVATPEGEILFKGSGESHGWIGGEERGDHSFAYTPT